MNTKTTMAHVSTIIAGDTIIYEGHKRTLSAHNIVRCPFFGTSILGDSYKGDGRKGMITIVLFKKWFKNEFKWVRQS
jgi:hypothetical protein